MKIYISIFLIVFITLCSCRKFTWDNPYDTTNPSNEPASLKNGLVAYYPFNGNANDESGNGNNGIVNGPTLSTDRFGRSSSSFSFDGVDDWIAVSNGMFINQIMSISLWVNTSTIMQNGRQILVCGSRTNAPWAIGYDITGLLGLLKNQGCDNYTNNTFNHKMVLNRWMNFIVVFNENIASIYIDGIPKESIPSNRINVACSSNALSIGNDIYLDSDFFSGKIDDIRIFNRALTQEEITYLANN